MQLLDFVIEEKEKIEESLNHYFNNLIKNEQDEILFNFYKKLKDFIIPSNGPAKRIRPMILIHTFFGIANDNRVEKYLDEIRKISISVELLHTASLIYEDVVDQDPYRRGFPTFHEILSKLFSEQNENEYGENRPWGNGTAINGGELCNFLGSSIIINSSKFKKDVKFKAIQAYNSGVIGIIKGKTIERYLMMKSLSNSTLEDYLIMAEAKTSSALDAAASIGAILADSRLTQITPIRNLMKNLGVSYQIKKDIEDSYGNPDLKSIDLSIREKKRNILIITAYKNASKNDRKDFDEIYNQKEEMTDEQVNRIRDIIKDSGSLEFSKIYSQNLISLAEQDIAKIYPGLRKESHQFFNELFNWVLKFDLF